jgi:hypothetical protein
MDSLIFTLYPEQLLDYSILTESSNVWRNLTANDGRRSHSSPGLAKTDPARSLAIRVVCRLAACGYPTGGCYVWGCSVCSTELRHHISQSYLT